MNQQEINKASCDNAFISLEPNDKPLSIEAVLFIGMKMIEDLGMMYATKKSKRKERFGMFECPVCGKRFKTRTVLAKNGYIKSCGCVGLKSFIERNTKHGMHKTRLYSTWINMIGRCYHKSRGCYPDYGGRGISVCDEWRGNFIFFRDWAVNNGYKEGLQIDRIDNGGNYCPENCRWVDKFMNAQNTRIKKTNKSGYRGVHLAFGKWSSDIISYGRRFHLGTFDTPEEAAVAFNDFVLKNGTSHVLNIIPKTWNT